MRLFSPSFRLTALLAPAAFLLMAVPAMAQMPVRNVFLNDKGELNGTAPLGTTQVRLLNEGQAQTVEIAADGSFNFAGPIEPGKYSLQFLNEDSQPLTDAYGQFELNLFEAADPAAPEGTTELFDPTAQPGDPLEPGEQMQAPGGPGGPFVPVGGGGGGGGGSDDDDDDLGWLWWLAGGGGIAAWAAGDGDGDDDDAGIPPVVSPIH